MKYKRIHTILKAKMKKDFGKPCPDFMVQCFNCQVWMMLGILRDIVATEDFERRYNLKKKWGTKLHV